MTGDAGSWDRTGILVKTLQVAWYLKDKPWTLFKAKKSFVKNS